MSSSSTRLRDASSSDDWLGQLLSEEDLAEFSTHVKSAALNMGRKVSEFVGKEASRAFPVIFALAQTILRNTFAFELAETRGRNQENPLLEEQSNALEDQSRNKRPRNETRKRKDISSGSTWILRSTLPSGLLAQLNQTEERQDAVLNWQDDAQLAEMGVCFLILSIVLLCGRRVEESRLRTYLAQLSLSMDRPLPSALQPFRGNQDSDVQHTQARQRATNDQRQTLATYLVQLQRQGYLEKIRPESVRASDGTVSEAATEYRWGPRAEIEIGEHAVSEFVLRMFSGVKQEEETRQDLTKRIERAAGSSLVG
ncbi:hypothetical protein MPSI1_002489 [Malassezia psittaci]|uniref:MAGE domain-containing protein n=1 Tax=Malassezia psittaci TaxID=1821823 RepID=A0AAF0FBD2_9BASI|nr:hypothetical protein MPSI1_002489 [Malassezia psittaci]